MILRIVFAVSSRFFSRSMELCRTRAKYASPIRCNEPWPQTRACLSFLTLRPARASQTSACALGKSFERKVDRFRHVPGRRRTAACVLSDTRYVMQSVCLFARGSFHRRSTRKHRFTLKSRSLAYGSFALLSLDGESERTRPTRSLREARLLVVGCFVGLCGIFWRSRSTEWINYWLKQLVPLREGAK